MKLKTQFLNFAVIPVMTVALSACGGGGDGGDGTTNPTARALMTVDSSNAEATSGLAYDGIATQQSFGISNLSGGSATNTNSPQTVQRVVQNYLTLNNSEQVTLTGAITTGTTQCNGGGTITVTNNSIAYNNCRENYPDNSYDITNGSATISNLLQSGDDISCTENMSGTFSFNNLNEREYDITGVLTNNSSINGSVTFSSSQAMVNTACKTTSSISGDYFSLKTNNEFVSFFNFNISGSRDTNLNYSYSYNITLDSSVLTGSLKIETILPIEGVETDPYPTSGHLRFTANSTTPGVPAIIDVEIDSTVGSGAVTLTVDVDGVPGTDDGYPRTMPWNEFEGL